MFSQSMRRFNKTCGWAISGGFARFAVAVAACKASLWKYQSLRSHSLWRPTQDLPCCCWTQNCGSIQNHSRDRALYCRSDATGEAASIRSFSPSVLHIHDVYIAMIDPRGAARTKKSPKLVTFVDGSDVPSYHRHSRQRKIRSKWVAPVAGEVLNRHAGRHSGGSD